MFVVTGATGNVGAPLVRALAATGAPVTAVSRSITEDAVPAGVRAVRADLSDPESLRDALEGARALFLHDTGAGAAGVRPRDILDVAKAGGVERVVLLSSLGVVTRPESPSHGQMMASFEQAVRESGMEWTILRPNGFHSNAYAWAESVRASRTVAAPFGDVGLPTVDPADIAEVAAVALSQEGHTGRHYALTGPALISPREKASVIGEVIGESVTFVELDREPALVQMLAFMSEPVAQTTLSVLGEPTEVEQRVSPDIERVLGRPATDFAGWVRRNAAAFR
jgi:uncharacterized protein YbjT (DUF2867 family)